MSARPSRLALWACSWGSRWSGFTLKYAGAQDKIASGETSTAGYVNLDVNLAWRLPGRDIRLLVRTASEVWA